MMLAKNLIANNIEQPLSLSYHMLLEGNHKIADVAITSGYKHATHFSSAFKKYFGYLPNKIKMIWLIIDPEPVLALFSYSSFCV